MTQLTRRRLFATAAAAGAATAVGSFNLTPSKAAAPSADKQAAGVYRYKVGGYEVTQISDGSRTAPMPDGFIVNATKEQANAGVAEAYMPAGQITIPFNPMVINTGSKLIMIDTGNGPGAYAATKGAVGQTHTNLAAAGIDRNAVDMVIISHFHGDHINGLRLADGGLAFPNAEIKVPAVEWAFWMDDANLSKANGFNKGQFPNPKKIFAGIENKVTKYEWGKEIAPGITSIATPGHTPGHTSFNVASGNAHIVVQSDVCNNPAVFMHHADWQAAFDNDPNMTIATRKKFYDMLAAEKSTVVGYHFSFPAVGHVEKDGANYRLVPVVWNPSL
jgi:glyoxylase-like metal-dependent hydrolase (beta-lactamase superfamily II)